MEQCRGIEPGVIASEEDKTTVFDDHPFINWIFRNGDHIPLWRERLSA